MEDCADSPNYALVQADIADAEAMAAVFTTHQPDAVMHLAAESHVDRSIDGPAAFIATNVTGTFKALGLWENTLMVLTSDNGGFVKSPEGGCETSYATPETPWSDHGHGTACFDGEAGALALLNAIVWFSLS